MKKIVLKEKEIAAAQKIFNNLDILPRPAVGDSRINKDRRLAPFLRLLP